MLGILFQFSFEIMPMRQGKLVGSLNATSYKVFSSFKLLGLLLKANLCLAVCWCW